MSSAAETQLDQLRSSSKSYLRLFGEDPGPPRLIVHNMTMLDNEISSLIAMELFSEADSLVPLMASQVERWRLDPVHCFPICDDALAYEPIPEPIPLSLEVTREIVNHHANFVQWWRTSEFPVEEAAQSLDRLTVLLRIREPNTHYHELPVSALCCRRADLACEWLRMWWPKDRNWKTKNLFRGQFAQRPQGFVVWAARRIQELGAGKEPEVNTMLAATVAALREQITTLPAQFSSGLWKRAIGLEAVRRVYARESTNLREIATALNLRECLR